MEHEVKLLDHGYLRYIEHWGSDEQIIEAARMSTGKGFLGWGPKKDGSLGDERLLRYLWEHKHVTPFEMAGMTIEVQAPIMVFREWHRHRTQCLDGSTLIHFESPKSRSNRRSVFKQPISELWRKWQPTIRKERQDRQTNPYWPRSQVAKMLLRSVDESTGEVIHSSVTDVIRGDFREMIEITSASGKKLIATKQHRMFTENGWMTLSEAISTGSMLAVERVRRNKVDRWDIEVDLSSEKWLPVVGSDGEYKVSTAGRVRAVKGYSTTRTTVKPGQLLVVRCAATGYNYVTMRLRGITRAITVHTLVLEAFVGPRPDGLEARHLDDNKANSALSNLAWGTAKENANDRTERDRQQRLTIGYEEIASVESVGTRRCYDLTVEGPWHNFVVNGFVVHNSYNEMSARYTPLPDVNYLPTVERLMLNSKTNKQAGTVLGAAVLTEELAEKFRSSLEKVYQIDQEMYEAALSAGVPKELARLHLPVGRYSRMRAGANLRNWLAFLSLRMDEAAQWEIQRYAYAVGDLIALHFPRTWELFHGTLGRTATTESVRG